MKILKTQYYEFITMKMQFDAFHDLMTISHLSLPDFTSNYGTWPSGTDIEGDVNIKAVKMDIRPVQDPFPALKLWLKDLNHWH